MTKLDSGTDDRVLSTAEGLCQTEEDVAVEMLEVLLTARAMLDEVLLLVRLMSEEVFEDCEGIRLEVVLLPLAASSDILEACRSRSLGSSGVPFNLLSRYSS